MANLTALPRSRADRLLRFTWRRVAVLVIAWVGAVVAHNVVYALLAPWYAPGWDEPFFFVLATLVLPAYAVVTLVYTLAAGLAERIHG